MSEDKIKIHLRGEGLEIDGTLYEVPMVRPGIFWIGRTRSLMAARWRCPCGKELDSATLFDGMMCMDHGYFVRCPACTRWYFHRPNLKIIEGGQPEGPIEDSLLQAIGSAGLCLVGCPATDLAQVPHRMLAAGVKVRPHRDVQDGDYVVFCISAPDGPMPGTVEAMKLCAGRRLAPVAIVMTKVELVDSDSLHALVRLEEMELLSRIIPKEVIERLPLYYDIDPGLPRKLVSRISQRPAMIVCHSALAD